MAQHAEGSVAPLDKDQYVGCTQGQDDCLLVEDTGIQSQFTRHH